MGNSSTSILNGDLSMRIPGDATQSVLWNSFKDVALFFALRLAFNPSPDIDKEATKAQIVDNWESQVRSDFSATLEEYRVAIRNGSAPNMLVTPGGQLIGVDLDTATEEFNINLTKVKGMIYRLLDQL